MSNKFLLFCAPRTGSSAIGNFLRDVEICLAYEPFRPAKWQDEKPDISFELARLFTNFDGIKHLYSHVSLEENKQILKYCHDNQIKVLHLRRRNKALAAISLILANETDVWQVDHKDISAQLLYQEKELPEFLFEDIDTRIEKLEETEKEIDKGPASNLEQIFYYEQLFNLGDEYEASSRVGTMLHFLNIEKKPYHHQMVKEHFGPGKKQNIPQMYQKIPNWKEICDHYGLQYE